MTRKLTQEEVLRRFKKKFGDRFDYSKFIYVDCYTEGVIICPKHGQFKQKAHNHWSSVYGCLKCAREIVKINLAKTKEEFIADARKTHGDKYNYDKVVYVNAHCDVTITCSKHGDFPQTPNNHINGHRCPGCRSEGQSAKQTYTQDEVITKFKACHGEKYTYDKVVYVYYQTDVIITCNNHGDFPQTPHNHWNGHGCPGCKADEARSTTEEFVEKAKLKHGEKYSYDKVIYVDSRDEVVITCPKHGDFSQTPDGHLTGRGCHKCNRSVGEEKISGELKERKIPSEEQKKFPECKHRSFLKFDNYAFSFNLLLEFDGRQHFEDCPYFNKTYSLEEIQEKDRIKNRFALDTKKNLVRISHSQLNKIPRILDRVLRKLTKNPELHLVEFYGSEYLPFLEKYSGENVACVVLRG